MEEESFIRAVKFNQHVQYFYLTFPALDRCSTHVHAGRQKTMATHDVITRLPLGSNGIRCEML